MGHANGAGAGAEEIERIGLSKVIGFLPKQMTAWLAVIAHRFVLYGGARGPGKSYWLRWALVCLHGYWANVFGVHNVTTGLFCETYPELRDRQIKKIKMEFPIELGELKSTQEEGLGFHLAPKYGGGMIALRNLDDPTKYQSAEFAAIAIDELTKLSVPDLDITNDFDVLRGSLRWPGVPSTKFLGATNPGNVGHAWVKKLWIDKDFPTRLKRLEKEFKFIKALPAENPYLTQEYWDDLNSLPEELRKAWVDGNWDVFVGMAFTGWNRDRHVRPAQELPSWWVRWRAVDWGYHAPFCCLWLAKDPDIGRIHVYREIYDKGMTDKQQARAIVDNTGINENIQMTFADPSMWARKNVEDVVTSTADIYTQHGVPLIKGDNDRISGKRKVDRILMSLPDGDPGLIIHENCPNLIRTIPALPYDKVRVEDVDTDAEDHAYDTLRYGLTNVRDPDKREPDEIPDWQRKKKSNLESISKLL